MRAGLGTRALLGLRPRALAGVGGTAHERCERPQRAAVPPPGAELGVLRESARDSPVAHGASAWQQHDPLEPVYSRALLGR